MTSAEPTGCTDAGNSFLDQLHNVLIYADWPARGSAPAVSKAWHHSLMQGTGEAHWQWLCERLRDEHLLYLPDTGMCQRGKQSSTCASTLGCVGVWVRCYSLHDEEGISRRSWPRLGRSEGRGAEIARLTGRCPRRHVAAVRF